MADGGTAGNNGGRPARRPILYLPIETKARELYGKMLLAARAAERGWQVVLGPQEPVREALRHGPRGVFVEMSIPDSRAKKMASYKARGHRLANLCEESVVYYDPLDYCRRKVGESAIPLVDIMLVAGAANERDLRRLRPSSNDRIALTGNPRFDTLTPKARGIYAPAAAELAGKFGRFLLVNTNFMRTNHFKHGPEKLIEQQREQNAIVDDEHAAMVRRQYAYKGAQMEKLKPILVAIAESGAFDKIVIRPHPSEKHDTWREWAKPYDRIEVLYEGSANSWMLAAHAILHTGCTTGIEGVLLDHPVLSFVPEPGHDLLNQSDAVSIQVSSAEAFLAESAAWRNLDQAGMRAHLTGQRAKLATLIANVDPPMATERILDALEKLDVPEAPINPFRSNPLTALWRNIRSGLRNRRGAYHRQKFPGLEAEEIAAPIATWLEAGVLGRAPNLARLPDGTWLFS